MASINGINIYIFRRIHIAAFPRAGAFIGAIILRFELRYNTCGTV